MSDPRLTALAASLPASVPFVGPEAQERSRKAPFAARLGANENVFGPSSRAIDALAKAASETWMYADPESYDLRQALAMHHKIPPANIMVGEGIDGLLGYLVRLFVAQGDAVVTSQGAYPTFNYHVAGYGGTLYQVPYYDDHENPAALLAAAHEHQAKLIYWANPDNPMGTWHDAKTVAKTIAALPDGCLLVLDEAYIDTAPEGTAPPLAPDTAQVIRMRTFSKAYGLAGARVGYAIGPEPLITAFNKVRNHFGMGRMAQAAALAALQDQAYLSQTIEKISTSRKRIVQIAEANDLACLPSATNFVAVDCGQDGDFARAVLAALLEAGIFVRMPFVAPQDRCIRVSCGPEAQMSLLAEALPRALKTARDAR